MRVITIDCNETIVLKVMHDGYHICNIGAFINDSSISMVRGQGSKANVNWFVYEGKIQEPELGKEVNEKISELKIAIEKLKQDLTK